MLMFLLVGCYDRIVTDLVLDTKRGTAHVERVTQNAWPNTVHCDDADVPACVEGIRASLAEDREELEQAGATVLTMGVRVVEGRLDVVQIFDAPLTSEVITGSGLGLLHVQQRTPAQIRRGRDGRDVYALVRAKPDEPGTVMEIRGRARVLDLTIDDDPIRAWMLLGRKARVHLDIVNLEDDGTPKTAGAWVAAMPGLAEAIAASGLVVPEGSGLAP